MDDRYVYIKVFSRARTWAVPLRRYVSSPRYLIPGSALLLAAAGYIVYQLWFGNHLTDRAALPLGPVSYQYVSGRPESRLRYPGAQQVEAFGAGERANPIEGGSTSAFTGAILATHDSPDQIYTWYADQLAARHYRPYDVLGASTWKSEQGYERGTRERFLVAIDDPTFLGAAIGRKVPSDENVFEFRYVIFPANR